ncbi:MAG TPA: amidohydrolase family protein [Terriglobales bacterium]|jgi:predicted TIM-barrel fold metal-dependent hydrolase|nr:amidohydrolase family protein [Terriglobales bacterium]
MGTMIDWHAHHTAPEVAERIRELTGKRPHIDAYDSADLSKRIKEMDEVGLDLQLVCQGAGVYADQLPAEQALEIVRQSNDVLAQRVAPHKDRLMGVTALSLKNIDASVKEIERTAAQGFRAVLLYPHVDGQMLVDTPATEPIFAKIAELNLPIFLHGAGTAQDPSLARLEDGGAGVAYAVLSDGEVAECCLRMIAGGVFDRHPNLKIVIRSSGGGLPLLLHRFFWKHKGPAGERRYSEIFLEHFLIDCASSDATTLAFLVEKLGENNMVFGSDYCGGLGPLSKGFSALNAQPNPDRVKNFMAKNSRQLLHL